MVSDEMEEKCWQETLQALKPVRQGKIVDGEQVHAWLKNWGTDKEETDG